MAGELEEEQDPARAFEIVNRYLGWGDPGEQNTPGIWFIGIEEAGEWGEPEKEKHPGDVQIDKVDRARRQLKEFKVRSNGNWYSCDTRDSQYRPTMTKVFPAIARIVCQFSASEKDPRKYRENHLFREGCKVFQTNLFPLGKPNSTEWPDSYKQIFGYGKDDIRFYKEKVKNTRFREITQRWLEYNPQVTICFGRGYEDEFRQLFGLQSQSSDPHSFISFDESKKIVITQHFSSPHWNKGLSDKLEIINAKLDEWDLKLP